MINFKDYILKLSRPALIILCWVFLFAVNVNAQKVKSFTPGLDYVRVVMLYNGDEKNTYEFLTIIRDVSNYYLPASMHLTGLNPGEEIKGVVPEELVNYDRDKIIFCDAKILVDYTPQQLSIIRCAVANGDMLVVIFDTETYHYKDEKNIINEILNVKLKEKPVWIYPQRMVFSSNLYGVKNIFHELYKYNESSEKSDSIQYLPYSYFFNNESILWDCKYGKGRVIATKRRGNYGNLIKLYNNGIDDSCFSLFPLSRKAVLSRNDNFERYPGGLLNENGEKVFGYKNVNNLIVSEKVPVDTKESSQIIKVILPAVKEKLIRNIAADLLITNDDKEITATLLSPFIEGEYEQKYPEPGKILWKIKQDGIKSFVVHDNLLFVADEKCGVKIFDVVTGDFVMTINNNADKYEIAGGLSVAPLQLNLTANGETRSSVDVVMTVVMPCREKQSGKYGLLAIMPGFRINILPPQMPVDKLPEDFLITDAEGLKINNENLSKYFTAVIPNGNHLTGSFNSWQLYSSENIKLPLKVSYKNELLGSMNLFPVKNPVFNNIGNNLQFFIPISEEKSGNSIISRGNEIYVSDEKGMIYALNCANMLFESTKSKPVASINNMVDKWLIKDRKISFITQNNEKYQIIDGDNYLRTMEKIGVISAGFAQMTNISGTAVSADITGKRVLLKKDDNYFDAGVIQKFIKIKDNAIVKFSVDDVPADFAGAEIWINSDDISIAGGDLLLNPGELEKDKSPLKLKVVNGENISWNGEVDGKMILNYSLAGNSGAVKITDQIKMKYNDRFITGKCYKNIADKITAVDFLAYIPRNISRLPDDLKPVVPSFFAADAHRIVHFNKYGKSDYQLNGYYGAKNGSFGFITSMQVLHNGNLLVCDAGKGKVAEINRNGRLIWCYPGNVEKYVDEFNNVNRKSDESTIKLNSPRDVRRYEIVKQANEIKTIIDDEEVSLGKAEITWQSTLIADTDNFRIIEITRPLVKLFNTSFNDGKTNFSFGSYYRPYCYYEYKGEKRFLRQTVTVIADGKSLGTVKPVSFINAQRYMDDLNLPDDDIILSGVRTRTLLAANNIPVDAPDIKGRKLRLFMLTRDNAEKMMQLMPNPFNNQFDLLPAGIQTNSIRRVFADGENAIIVHDLNDIYSLKTNRTADKSSIELQSDEKISVFSYAPFRWYAGEGLKSLIAGIDGTLSCGDIKILKENGIYPGDTMEMKYPLVIAIDWDANE